MDSYTELQEKLYLCLYYLALSVLKNYISDWSKLRYLHTSSSHICKKIIPSIRKYTSFVITVVV